MISDHNIKPKANEAGAKVFGACIICGSLFLLIVGVLLGYSFWNSNSDSNQQQTSLDSLNNSGAISDAARELANQDTANQTNANGNGANESGSILPPSTPLNPQSVPHHTGHVSQFYLYGLPLVLIVLGVKGISFGTATIKSGLIGAKPEKHAS